MRPLSCRGQPPRRAPARRRFDELPDDILILIFCQCRIDGLFSLRLTSSKSRDLISERIATIAPCVARSTFPHNDLLLTPPADPSLYTIDWLKGLIPQQLACILVDGHRFAYEGFEQRYGIPAEDPYGDKLRAGVANGWRVLRRLSQVSKEVYQMETRSILGSTTDMTWKMVHPSRFKLEVSRKREEIVFNKRLEYIERMPKHLIRDYRIMFMMLSSTFRTRANYSDDYFPWVFDWGNGIDNQRLVRRGSSWMTWFLLDQGPDVFWQQWCILPPEDARTKNYIRDKSIEAWFGASKIAPDEFLRGFVPETWTDVNEKWHGIQRDYGNKVQKAINEKAGSPPSFDFAFAFTFFAQALKHRQQREESGLPPPKETLRHVPFFVDFRCPKALVQKYSMLRQERDGMIAQRGAGSVPRNG